MTDRERIEIVVDDWSDVPLLAWIMAAYEAGEESQGPGRLVTTVLALVFGFLVGWSL
jgi:hypothetical protein